MTREVFSPTRTFRSAAMLICALLILTALEASSQQPGASLGSLPSEAQGPISAAPGKDNSTYWVHRSAAAFHGENPRQALVADPWIQQAQLAASDEAANDQFASSVAVSGGTVVVGAYDHSVGSNQKQGTAYIFVQNGNGTWTQQAELTASDGGANDYFGASVAVSGNTVVVGASCHPFDPSTGNCGPGAAYVFVQNGNGTWTQQAELTASDGEATDGFGSSLAVDGHTAVAGAPCHPNVPNGTCNGSGAAYVFMQSGGTWTQQAELTPSEGAGNDYFGSAVALSGSTVVVGAWAANDTQGAVYVFVQGGTTWTQQAELAPSCGGIETYFGTSVAVDGSTLVAGAPLCQINQGAAFVFVQSGGTWSGQAELSDGAYGFFGTSVGLSGGTAVVGAPWQGTAYVFVQNGSNWNQQAELTVYDPGSDYLFANSIAISDSTVVIGAPSQNSPLGAAYVFGSSGPLYTLSPAPSILIITPAEPGISTITITPFNGFSGSVSLSAQGLPAGVTASFSPNPATTTSTLTLTSSETSDPGTVEILGTSGNLTQLTTLAVVSPTTVKLPPSLSFGGEAVSSTSAPKTLTLKNTGTATLYIFDIAISGDFAISTTTCGATLAPRKSCTVKVTFTPMEVGALTGTLTFSDNTANSPQTVALKGAGVAPATLTPASASYANQAVGTTSKPKLFTLTNDQRVELTSIAISTTGDFAVSATTCGTSLAAKGKCTISVTFTPTETGTTTGHLIVSDSAGNSPQTSNLTGRGD